MQNPNAFAAAVTTFLVWLLGAALKQWHITALSPTQLLAAAGGATTVVLWIGRVGLIGAFRRIMRGAQTVVTGPSSTSSSSEAD
jgi:hypothetical protein